MVISIEHEKYVFIYKKCNKRKNNAIFKGNKEKRPCKQSQAPTHFQLLL